MSVREKRLQNEYIQLRELVTNSAGSLKITSKEGNPPSKYVIEYHCKGVEKLNSGNAVFRNVHQVEISLGSNYPREQPSAKFLTPIFHPNVYSNKNVCLGDYWTMAETLPLLVLRIGKIIQYSKDVMNLNSPAHSDAKKWAKNNMSDFPIDNQTFKIQMVWEDL